MTVLRDVLDDSGGRLTDSVGLGVLTRVIPRDLVDEVLNATGKNEQRKRLLPARVVVYYVLALTFVLRGRLRGSAAEAGQRTAVSAFVEK